MDPARDDAGEQVAQSERDSLAEGLHDYAGTPSGATTSAGPSRSRDPTRLRTRGPRRPSRPPVCSRRAAVLAHGRGPLPDRQLHPFETEDGEPRAGGAEGAGRAGPRDDEAARARRPCHRRGADAAARSRSKSGDARDARGRGDGGGPEDAQVIPTSSGCCAGRASWRPPRRSAARRRRRRSASPSGRGAAADAAAAAGPADGGTPGGLRAGLGREALALQTALERRRRNRRCARR